MIFPKTPSESDVEDGAGDVSVFDGIVDVLDAVREGEVGGRLERRRILEKSVGERRG